MKVGDWDHRGKVETFLSASMIVGGYIGYIVRK